MVKTLFDIGPDGLILVWGVIASVAVALLTWRRIALKAAALFLGGVTLGLIVWLLWLLRLESPARFTGSSRRLSSSSRAHSSSAPHD